MCYDTSECIIINNFYYQTYDFLSPDTAFKALKEQFGNFSPHEAWQYSALKYSYRPILLYQLSNYYHSQTEICRQTEK